MRISLDLNSIDDYRLFLKIKSLPTFRFVGRTAEVPEEYVSRLGLSAPLTGGTVYRPIPGLFDYQQFCTSLAIKKRKFAVFMECGYGKSLCLLEFARHAQSVLGPTRRVLIVSPLMVIRQTMREVKRFYPAATPLELTQVKAADLPRWITTVGSEVGITNYEALTSAVPRGRLGALICDESAYLKSAYGKWGQEIIRLGKGLDWKLALTGTPAPNDRIEYANHAVFLDAFPTVNSFLARFFVNRGQTDNRWELKPHALRPFYRALSHWSIFLTNPATYGFRDNAGTIPSVRVHVHDVDLTVEQSALACQETGMLFANEPGGITGRSTLGQLAKGRFRGQDVATAKPEFIRSLVDTWSHEESTIIWCIYNHEQELLERAFPDALSIKGTTPYEDRARMIEDFQAGRNRVMISKAKVLGLGLNLQIATRQVFSGIQDSWESWHQCIKRSNRVGSTKPLQVHVPVTDLERPMLATVLRKARRIDEDTAEQEAIFKREAFDA